MWQAMCWTGGREECQFGCERELEATAAPARVPVDFSSTGFVQILFLSLLHREKILLFEVTAIQISGKQFGTPVIGFGFSSVYGHIWLLTCRAITCQYCIAYVRCHRIDYLCMCLSVLARAACALRPVYHVTSPLRKSTKLSHHSLAPRSTQHRRCIALRPMQVDGRHDSSKTACGEHALPLSTTDALIDIFISRLKKRKYDKPLGVPTLRHPQFSPGPAIFAPQISRPGPHPSKKPSLACLRRRVCGDLRNHSQGLPSLNKK